MRRADAAVAPVVALAAAIAFSAPAGAARAEDAGAAVRAGQTLYRQGRGPGGAVLSATVQGGLPLTGAQVSCASCHGRSGLGQIEGRIRAPPVSRPFLAAPRTARSRSRPAYDDAALARALRDGVDAGGNRLDPLMPRYRIGDAELAALLAYLRTLSAVPSPGASDAEVHLATVIAPDAPAAERRTMLEVLRGWFAAKTASQRDLRQRHGPGWPEAYPDWTLHEWTLSGPPSAWRAQLEAAYRHRPVFAVVSGVGRSWDPVQRFCEAHEIPCLLPNVDTPPPPGGDRYALYFSDGTVLEGRAIAAHLAARGARSVTQVFRAGGEGERGASALRAASAGTALRVEDVPLRGAALPAALPRADATVLWLEDADLAALPARAADRGDVYVSGTLLRGAPPPPGRLGAAAIVADPRAPAPEAERRYAQLASWRAGRGLAQLPPELRRIADQTFFAAFVLSGGLGELRRNYLREYLYEGIDHMSGLDAWSASYPRLSFGPGQRVLSKGCWMIPLDLGRPAEWIVP